MPVFEDLGVFGFSPKGGGTHRYFVTGDTSKPVIVLLSGFMDAHSNLGQILPLLRRNYCVIVPELPGWGESLESVAPLRIEQYAAYLNELVDFLGVKPVVLVGHCAGSLLAMEYALLSTVSVRELFLVSVPQFGGMWPVQLGRMPLRLVKQLRKAKQHKGNIQYQISNIKSPMRAEHLETNMLDMVGFDFRRISRIGARVHFIHGGKDPFVRSGHVKRLQGFLPTATFDELARAGHVPGGEMPGVLAAVILGYLHGNHH